MFIFLNFLKTLVSLWLTNKSVISSKFSINHVNGTATMHTALAALDVKPDDEVIVTPLTMSSTSLAVLHNNSTPIFADVDKKTYNIDPKSIEKNITKKTKAIISVSLYGLSPDYDSILKICDKHNLYLIESKIFPTWKLKFLIKKLKNRTLN